MENTSVNTTTEVVSSSIESNSIEASFEPSMDSAESHTKATFGLSTSEEKISDKKSEGVSTEVDQSLFQSWGLSKNVLKSLEEMNFKNPTPIQRQAIPLLLGRQKDFVGLAATGTGKTGAFGIPLVETIDASSKSVQALVMCPTRELAAQVEAQLQKIAKWKGLNTLTVFGGSSYDRQVSALKRGVHIVVGTPGRLCDLVDRKVLKLNDVQTLVLDEADEMISMGFQDDLEKILEAIGEEETKRKWLFSATMSPEIRRVVSKYLPDYDKVEIHKQDSEKPQIEQIYYTIYPDRKLQMLSSVLYMNPEFYGLIFCQTKREVQEITEWLKRKSFKVDCLHGDRPQREREFILKDFRTGRVKILVATDVAARGLDINDLTHVINFSLPREVESYVHRIGRTGRAGKKGLALSIVAPHEVKLLKRIQQVTKANLVKGVAPSNDELNLYRVKDAINALNAVQDNDVTYRAGKFLDKKISELKELFNFEFTVEEFLKRYLVAEHPDIFENRDTSMDFVGDGIVPREMQSRGDSSSGGRFERDWGNPRYSNGGGRSGGGYGGRSGGGYRGDSRGGRSEGRDDDRRSSGGGRGFPSRSSASGSDRGFERSSSRGGADRPEQRSERGGQYTGSGGFRPRESSRDSSRDTGGGYRGDSQRESTRPAGRTWNADDHEDRPSRSKRFSN